LDEQTLFKPKVQNVIEALANPLETRTKEQISEDCGYHAKSIFRLQKQPAFREAVRQRLTENVGTNLYAVFATLFNLARQGDLKACELLLKSAGVLAPDGSRTTVTIGDTNRLADDSYVSRIAAAVRQTPAPVDVTNS